MPFPAALVPFIAPVVGAVSSALIVRQQQKFQERMSNTAHQREMRDLQRAGLNPQLSVGGSGGASTPPGASMDLSRGVATALEVQRSRAEIKLLEASADREGANAALARTQAADISTTAAAGRLENIRTQADIAKLNHDQLQMLMPLVLERARAEIDASMSSAQAAKARALLDEAARAGALNAEQFEKRIGEMGPALRMLFEFLRAGGRLTTPGR